VVVTADVLARQAVQRAGFPAEELRPLRVHSNAVFVLPLQRIVVRAGGGADAPGRAERAVAVTRWLIEMGFPAVEPVSSVRQPVLMPDGASGLSATTFWHLVDVADRQPTAAELGRLLHRHHELHAPPFDVPFFRPLDRLVAAANSSPWLSETDREWLLGRAAQLQSQIDRVTGSGLLRVGLVHGDAQLGNVLPAAGGSAVLADWDGAAIAPLAWDLAPTAAEPRFGGRSEVLDELLVAYGADLTTVPGWRVLCDIYELRSVAAHIRRAPDSPPHAVEAAVRIASLRAGDRSVRWHGVG
jgi:aminoglycoside phosphotransferase